VKKIALIFLLMFYIFAANSCSMLPQNFNDPQGPVYLGEYATEPASYNGRIKLVTWNLRHGERVDEAIKTLQNGEPLRDADVVLLQEMDEVGVERMARALSYNYVFYPAIFNPRHGKSQGNAILTKWPIRSYSKTVLPKLGSELMQTRISVKATIVVNEVEVDVYNEHLETLWLLPLRVNYQADYLVRQIDPKRISIVAGDFNSWNNLVIAYLEQLFNDIGFVRVSAGTGYTFKAGLLRLTLDHIFTNHEEDFRVGIWRNTDASDHYPLWVDLEMAGFPSD